MCLYAPICVCMCYNICVTQTSWRQKMRSVRTNQIISALLLIGIVLEVWVIYIIGGVIWNMVC